MLQTQRLLHHTGSNVSNNEQFKLHTSLSQTHTHTHLRSKHTTLCACVMNVLLVSVSKRTHIQHEDCLCTFRLNVHTHTHTLLYLLVGYKQMYCKDLIVDTMNEIFLFIAYKYSIYTVCSTKIFDLLLALIFKKKGEK